MILVQFFVYFWQMKMKVFEMIVQIVMWTIASFRIRERPTFTSSSLHFDKNLR